MGNAAEPDRAEIKKLRREFDDARKEYQHRIDAAKKALIEIQRTYETAVSRSQRSVDDEAKAHAERVSIAEREVKDARKGSLVASVGPVRLFDDRIETPDGVAPLDNSIRASVEASGTKTEKSDSRETALLLETPRFDAVVRIDPNQTTRAREVAAKINTLAKNASDSLEAHAARLRGAERRLRAMRSDTAALDRRRSELRTTEENTADVDEARDKLTAAEAARGDIDSLTDKLRELDPTAKIKKVRARRRPIWTWWRRRSRKTQAAIASGLILGSLVVIGALAAPPSSEDKAAEQTVTQQQGKELAELSLVEPSSAQTTVRKARATLRGDVIAGSKVLLNGRRLTLRGTHFASTVQLRLGRNTFTLEASRQGYDPTSQTIVLIREKPLVSLVVSRPSNFGVVRQPSVTVSGTVTPGSQVRVGGATVPLSGRRFDRDVALSQGKNTIWVVANRPGYAPHGFRLVVTRRLSASELAELAAQRRQAFMNAAQTIPYNQLIKNPDRYSGTRVHYYGEILQVQEDVGGGFMLLSVTNLGYDIWDDQIWVNYVGSIRGGEGDQLTVYGTVVGSKSYETQIGGETFVPEVDAKYVVE